MVDLFSPKLILLRLLIVVVGVVVLFAGAQYYSGERLPTAVMVILGGFILAIFGSLLVGKYLLLRLQKKGKK